MTRHANTIVIGSRVDRDFAERVRELAQSQDRSLGAVIRHALRRELAETTTDRPTAA